MGLDSVELVMGFEEAFGFSIPDEEAVRLVTPRRVIQYARTRLPMTPADGCLSQRTFYALRRAVRSDFPPGEPLRPATPLRPLGTRREWPAEWMRIRVRAGEPGWPETVRWTRRPDTLGGLTRHVAAHAAQDAARRGEPWTAEGLELTVREVIRDVVGAEGFPLDVDFVRDLRID